MKSLVICGSRRFKPEIRRFAQKLRGKGVIVYEPHLTNFDWDKLPQDSSEYIALGLTHDHFYKVKMADVVFLYNPNGYCGNSVTLELGCAAALGKPIYALSNKDQELCRKVLIREVVKTPRELIKRLK